MILMISNYLNMFWPYRCRLPRENSHIILKPIYVYNQGWEFTNRFSERIARFFPKNERMSDSLKKMSDSLICSFLVSDLSDLLTIAHFLWAIRSLRSFLVSDMSDSLTSFKMYCTMPRPTLHSIIQRRVQLCTVKHSPESFSFIICSAKTNLFACQSGAWLALNQNKIVWQYRYLFNLNRVKTELLICRLEKEK